MAIASQNLSARLKALPDAVRFELFDFLGLLPRNEAETEELIKKFERRLEQKAAACKVFN